MNHQGTESILELAVERLQVAELLLRLARDKRLIATGGYAKLRQATMPSNVQAEGAAQDLLRSSLRAPGSAARDSEKGN